MLSEIFCLLFYDVTFQNLILFNLFYAFPPLLLKLFILTPYINSVTTVVNYFQALTVSLYPGTGEVERKTERTVANVL